MPVEMSAFTISKSRQRSLVTARNLVRLLSPFIREHYPLFYKGFGFTEERFFTNQLFLWNIHIWLLIRRCGFEPDEAMLVHSLSKVYWEKWQAAHAAEEENKISARLKAREKGVLPSAIYAFWVALDMALNKGTDREIAAALYRNDPIPDHFETITLQQLENVVRYLRYQMLFLDSLPSDQLLGASFAFPSPAPVLTVDGAVAP
eukprot:EG_transcript_22479